MQRQLNHIERQLAYVRHLLETGTAGRKLLMDAIQTFAAQEQKTLDALTTALTSLDGEIQGLKTSAAANDNTDLAPEDQAALDAISAKSAALTTAMQALVTNAGPAASDPLPGSTLPTGTGGTTDTGTGVDPGLAVGGQTPIPEPVPTGIPTNDTSGTDGNTDTSTVTGTGTNG